MKREREDYFKYGCLCSPVGEEGGGGGVRRATEKEVKSEERERVHE